MQINDPDKAPVAVSTEAQLEEIDLSSPVSAPAGIPAEDAPEGDAESSFSWPAPEPLNNATITTPYYRVLGDQWDDLATTIALPPDTVARTLNYGETNPHAASMVDSAQGENWAESVSLGINHGSFHDNALPAAKREGANWQQQISPVDGGRAMSLATPKFGGDEGPLLTGERAMLRVSALLGRGSIVQIPLWHSGFWITVKSPGEIELLDALQHISDNKINFGRSTNGLTFANHVVVTNSAIVDLAMRSMFETTVAGFNTTDKIRGAINAMDIPAIAWGLAAAVYPKGFQFERALLDARGVATTVVRELLNVGTCLYTDRNCLNDWQVSHMAQRVTGSMNPASLPIYRDHFVVGKRRTIMLSDEVGITLRTPSVDEYLNSGQRWVDELVQSVTNAFAQDLTEKQRNDMIYDRAKATSMRQYVHWIESIDMPKLGKQIVDRPTLEMTISNMSSDDVVRDKYYKAVQQYINDSMVSIVAVPQVHVDESDKVLPRFENIIPIDPVSVFFSLLYQKIQQIRQRP
jgi:hypothetical protein